MPSYSQSSQKRLESCHIDIQTIFNEVIKTVDHSIFCGHRNKQEQTKAFEANLSQVQYPNSRHNSIPSMAIDAGPYFPELKNTDWKDHKAFAFFAGYVKCTAFRLFNEGKIKHSIRWGGDWDSDGRTLDQTFNDLPHFELVRVK